MPKWNARWIWWEKTEPSLEEGSPYPPMRPDSIGFIRRTFLLSSAPVEITARVCANSRYVLFVNGALIGRGPIRSEPLHAYYDTYDLAPYLKPGRNSVGALCRYYGRSNVFWKPSIPHGEVGLGWFLFEANGSYGDGSELVLASDETWKALAAPYEEHTPDIWRQANPSIEILDGFKMPLGWIDSSFNDEAWPGAVVLEWQGLGLPASGPPADPHPLVTESPLGQLVERDVVPARLVAEGLSDYEPGPNPLEDFQGATVIRSETGSLKFPQQMRAGAFATFDFGRIVRAHPHLEVSAPEGSVIDLSCGEDLGVDGRPVILPREWVMRYRSAGRDQEVVESFEGLGFRYLSIRSSAEAAIRFVGAREVHYPRQSAGHFECDDKVVNEIWQAGVRTLDLCSTDAFIDCPGREQRAWLGDAWLTSLISLVSNADTRLVKRTLRLHAEGQRPDGLFSAAAAGDISLRPSTIPDFSLHWIRGLARTWQYTGDEELVDELLPHVPRVIDFFENFRAEDDLLTIVPGWVFIDWAQTERGPKMAALDALYILALEDFASLAAARGQKRWAGRARVLARRSRRAFSLYWDARRRVFVDALFEDRAGRRVSQQTNSLAIVARCAPKSRWRGILDFILDEARLQVTKTPADSMDWSQRLSFQWRDPQGFDDETNVVAAQPFFCHFLHEAIVMAGRRSALPSMIRRWDAQLQSGNGCFEEYWSAPPGTSSKCHVWSATPVYDLTTYFLGVRPLRPGFDEAEVRPFFGPFDRLAGSVPTPHGPIVVDVTRGTDGPTGQVQIPAGVRCKVGFSEFPLAVDRVVEGPAIVAAETLLR